MRKEWHYARPMICANASLHCLVPCYNILGLLTSPRWSNPHAALDQSPPPPTFLSVLESSFAQSIVSSASPLPLLLTLRSQSRPHSFEQFASFPVFIALGMRSSLPLPVQAAHSEVVFYIAPNLRRQP